MNLEDIERLVQCLARSPVGTLELELEGKRLVLYGPADGGGLGAWPESASQGMPHAETPAAALDFIRAPAAGVFYANHPLAERPSRWPIARSRPASQWATCVSVQCSVR